MLGLGDGDLGGVVGCNLRVGGVKLGSVREMLARSRVVGCTVGGGGGGGRVCVSWGEGALQ